jgi:hypothetical protein
MVDWPCQIIRNFSDINLGCGRGVSSAVTAALAEFEEVIILEDDCVPEPTFFRYAQEMLERYRDDPRVMLVGGTCLTKFTPEFPYSYAFTRYTPIWGWATWRSAWKLYDFKLRLWPEVRDAGLVRYLIRDRREADFWNGKFNEVFNHKLDTWDYQWCFSLLIHQGLAAYPVTNQIRNIGEDGVHYKGKSSMLNTPTGQLVFPLRHPPIVYCHAARDKEIAARSFLPRLPQRILRKALQLINR